MTTHTEPPKAGFRLSQLIYDTRYRSITIQVVAVLLLGGAFYWLMGNTVENLRVQGKSFDLGFLSNRAGYDINQRLIDYDSNATHGRAALVGILNTLLVAVLGCILATVLGVIFGVLRLSKNWIVAKLATVYVEGFRNVPLLLWIIAIFAILTESTPEPRDFREDGPASMSLFGTIAITTRGIYVPRPIFGDGAPTLLAVFVLSVGAAIFLRRQSVARQAETGRPPMPVWQSILLVIAVTGLFFCLQGGVSATLFGLVQIGAVVSVALVAFGLQKPATAALGLDGAVAWTVGGLFAIAAAAAWQFGIAGTVWPAAQSALAIDTAFAPSVAWEFPTMGRFNFEGGVQLGNPLIALWIALSLYTGAFIAEIVRGGILAVSKGQSEAAFALGLRPSRTMSLVILPQALRVIIPPLISQFLNLTKNSSLAIAIGYMDVRSTLGGITVNQTGRELEGIVLVGLFYLTISLLIASSMNFFNNRVKLKER